MATISSAVPADIAEMQHDTQQPSDDGTDERRNRLLADPEIIWECLGPDGMYGSYPEHIRHPEWQVTVMQDMDNYQALQIGRAFRSGNFEAFSRLVWDQFEAHINYLSTLED